MAQQNTDALKIVRDALDIERDERDDYLSMRCGADTQLRERVDVLLLRIAGENSSNELADPEWPVAALDAGSVDVLTGQMLGPFRVVERVGRGGMGIVYRGLREGADLALKVAITG